MDGKQGLCKISSRVHLATPAYTYIYIYMHLAIYADVVVDIQEIKIT